MTIKSEGLAEQYIEMAKAIHRVRELHQTDFCPPECCSHKVCNECVNNYPCPTIRILDGEQE